MPQQITLYRFANPGEVMPPGTLRLRNLNEKWVMHTRPLPVSHWYEQPIVGRTFAVGSNPALLPLPPDPDAIPAASAALIDGTLYRRLKDGEAITKGCVLVDPKRLAWCSANEATWGLPFSNNDYWVYFTPVLAKSAPDPRPNVALYRFADEDEVLPPGTVRTYFDRSLKSACVPNSQIGAGHYPEPCPGVRYLRGEHLPLIPRPRRPIPGGDGMSTKLPYPDVAIIDGSLYRVLKPEDRICSETKIVLGDAIETIKPPLYGAKAQQVGLCVELVWAATGYQASPSGWWNGVYGCDPYDGPDTALVAKGLGDVQPRPWYYDKAVSLLPDGYEVCEHCDLGISLVFGVIPWGWLHVWRCIPIEGLLYARAKMEVDERPVYRFLDKGETIQAGDEVRLKTSFLGWFPSGDVGGRHINPGAMEYRRQVGTMNDLHSKQK